MKAIVTVCAMIVAGALGFLVEPELRPMLTGESAIVKNNDGDNSAKAILIKLNELTPEQLPKYVMIKKQSQYESAGITFTVPKGSLAELKGVENNMVSVVPKGSTDTILIPIDATDLVLQLKANPPSTTPVSNNPTIPEVLPNTPAVPETPATTPPIPDTPPAPGTGTMADNNPPVVTPPTTPPTTVPKTPPSTPPAAPVTPPNPSTPVATSAIATLMQQSIANQDIKEFSSDQVTDWKPGEDETIDGVPYQTGTAFYTTTTPFGSTTMKAKALIREGKVQRWIWPHTGIELK